VLASAVALGAVWSGMALSYASPRLPPSFGIVALVTAGYAAVAAASTLWRHTGQSH
jgi:zinc/manganese transport system permease protein